MESYKVLRFEVENVLGVRLAVIEPGPGVTVVKGRNESGKTSMLTALRMCLGGRAQEPEVPVRAGHAEGTVLVILGDDGKPAFRVEKVLRRGAESRLILTTADGDPVRRPQEILSGFLSSFTFGVRDFLEPPGAKTPETVGRRQKELLLKAFPAGADLDLLAKREKDLVAERLECGRDIEAQERNLPERPPEDEAVPEAPDIAAIDARLLAEDDKEIARVKAMQALHETKAELRECEQAVVAAQEHLRRAHEALADAETIRDKYRAAVAARRAEYDALPVESDRAPIREERQKAIECGNARAAAEARNQERARQREKRKAAIERLQKLQREHQELNGKIELVRHERQAAIAAAKFPIEGLSVDEVGVTLGGVPFAQASGGKRLETALAVGAAASPTLRTILIDEADALDDEAIERVRAFAAERDFQVILACVRSDDPGAVELREGANVEPVT